MKKTVFLFIGLIFALMVSAQPANYYNSANGLTGNQLKVALHNIVKGHTQVSYSNLWSAFWSTDYKGNGVVWDMYSDKPNGNPPYIYHLGQDQCGQYDSEGDCYNREHSWPSSWFNDQSIPRSDLHHIFPVDGYVNNKRGNNAFVPRRGLLALQSLESNAQLSFATRMEDWTCLGQHKRQPEFPVVTRESRRNSRKTTWLPRHRKMKPFPATAPQEKSHVRNWRSKGHLAPLMRPTKFPEIPVSLERNTEVFRHPLL